MTMRRGFVTGIGLFLAATTALAAPGEERRGDGEPPMDRGQRQKMMQKLHMMAAIELGDLLGLDSAGTIKLTERLKRFDDPRIQTQLDNFEAMHQLKRAAKGEAGADVPALIKRIGDNRVKLAQLDQQELADLTKDLSTDKAAKVAVFLARFPRRVEHMAHAARHGGRGGPEGEGPRGAPLHPWMPEEE
jgi:hypothetical protein